MNGGILKAAGYGATAALAGFLLSTTSARAADLGGNCCADLEERVAELEATTARKGNRRVSLTVSGQVNTAIMAWDQGVQDAMMVVDNGVSRSGFNFDGTAKINPNLTAGFQMVIGLATGARSHQTSQLDDDGGATGDGTLGVELANWFLRHDRLGEIRVGRINSASSGTTTVDLGGAGVIANANAQLWLGGFFVTDGAVAAASSPKWSTLMGGNYVGISGLSRQNAISYTTPTLHGFSAQAAWGEGDGLDRDMWDVALRYAGEHAGFRIAAAISYGENAGSTSDFQDSPTVGTSAEKWQGSASILHVASGLFLTGAYVNQSYDVAVPDTTYWYTQGGITRNWTGLGNTVLYGEYGRFEDGGVGTLYGLTGAGLTQHTISSSEVSFWGIGVVQHIDAAAMELYLSYRMYEASMTSTAGGGVGQTAVFADGSLDDLSVVAAGARIRF